MKLKIINATGNASGDVELPVQFSEPVREDLIKKAVLAIQNNNRQAYGTAPGAGMRQSAEVSKRRRDYRGCYGKGISRSNRKILSRRGSQMYWVGAVSPETVGGRRAHPPKAKKIWSWKLNTNERRKAIRSAMSATMIKELVQKRGHFVPETYPFIINDDFEKFEKTKDLLAAISKIGFEAELSRALDIGRRAGVGKLRGRRKTVKKSLLLVVTDTSKILRASKNIPGIDVVNVKLLNAVLLAPGGHYGRATLFTAKAVEELRKGLFTKDYSVPSVPNPAKKNEKKNEQKKTK